MSVSTGTFLELSQGWTLTASNPATVPAGIRDAVNAGVPLTMPGEATPALLAAGLIPDPFDADNETKVRWIEDVDWTLTCHFDWHDDGSTRHDLVAAGVDTIAAVSLNDQPVGTTRNFHRTYRWDIAPLLKEGDNTLQFAFTSSDREARRLEQQHGYYPHTNDHPFNQIRKPSYQFGWDWGIDAAGAGITRLLGIESWTGSRIVSVVPCVDIRDGRTGVVTLTTTVERDSGRQIPGNFDTYRDDPVDLDITLSGHGTHTTIHTKVNARQNTNTTTIEIPNAQKWWPIGYGNQPLYTITTTTNKSTAVHQIGIRTTEIRTAADEIGRPFQILINGVTIHARGYNWIPSDVFTSRITKSYFEKGMKDLVESNSNMARVWGGGFYEPDDFYELADQMGIMVWQDFALACAAYAEDADTQAEIEAEAREQITRLASHPSLVVWNGSNENIMGYSNWSGFKQALNDDDTQANDYGYGERGWGDYYYSEPFPRLLEQIDPTRIYIPSSPISLSKYTSPNVDTDGTMHIWDVWNNVDYRAFLKYTPRFADEFGYQAPPAWSTLQRVVHDGITPFGKQTLAHQKAEDGNLKMARGMRSHLTPGSFNDVSLDKQGGDHWLIDTDTWDDPEDWHWACQLQQAEAIRFGISHMRSLEPINSGALIWQLNDDWPVISWAAVDFYGHRKPLWYASRDFFAPQFATIQPRISPEAHKVYSWVGNDPEPDALALELSNDTLSSWAGTWIIKRIALNGDLLAQHEYEVSLNPTSHATVLLDSGISAFSDPANEIIVATPSTPGFARVIYNPTDIIDQNLTPNPLQASVTETTTGYELSLHATAYTRDAFCMADKTNPTATIDGGMASLLPGETLTWTITTPHLDNPQQLTNPHTLRTANDLKK